MSTPRTQSLVGRWRPQLTFYPQRQGILERLESQEILLKFRMPDDLIQVVLRGIGAMEIGPGHVRMDISSPSYVDADVVTCIRDVLSSFAPTTSSWNVGATHIVPTHMNYDDARARAMAGWLRQPFGRAVDAAVLQDGVDPNTGFRFQCEYGVISHVEAFSRLASHIGRLTDPPDEELEIDLTNLPEVGTFARWIWTVPADVSGDAVGDVAISVRERCISLSDKWSEMMHSLYHEESKYTPESGKRVTEQ